MSSTHIAQDVLSGVSELTAPHHPTKKYTEVALSVEYTRHLRPWAMRVVCGGKERHDRVARLNHRPRLG